MPPGLSHPFFIVPLSYLILMIAISVWRKFSGSSAINQYFADRSLEVLSVAKADPWVDCGSFRAAIWSSLTTEYYNVTLNHRENPDDGGLYAVHFLPFTGLISTVSKGAFRE
jgi:hypothetical protein